MLGMASGTFDLLTPPIFIGTGLGPTSIIAAHLLGGSGSPLDLAIADSTTHSVSLLQGDGQGGFRSCSEARIGKRKINPSGRREGRLHRRRPHGPGHRVGGIPDSPNSVVIELNQGNGQFSQAGSVGLVLHNTPLVGKLRTATVCPTCRRRRALATSSIARASPASPAPSSRRSRSTPASPRATSPGCRTPLEGPLLASVDAQDDAVSLYAYRDGGFVRVGSLPTGQLPAQIIAADLNGDGWDDLVVRNAGDGTLSVFFGNDVHRAASSTGLRPTFLPPVTLPVGLGVSDVQAVDTTGERPARPGGHQRADRPGERPAQPGRRDLRAARALSRRDRACPRSIPAARPRSPAWRRRRAWPPGRSRRAVRPTW